LAPRDKHKLLAEFRKNKKNRSVDEVQELLAAFGFQYRPARKEQGGLWRRGMFTVTLPQPHGSRDRSLKPAYISIVIRIIEAAEATDAQQEDS
jgi:hypothetical protein